MRVELSDQKKDIFGVGIEDGVEGGLEISLITLKEVLTFLFGSYMAINFLLSLTNSGVSC